MGMEIAGGSSLPDVPNPVQVNGKSVQWDDALDVVVGYAFEDVDLAWLRPDGAVGSDLAGSVPRWAYRNYDCIAASDGPLLGDLDVLVANAINAQMGGGAIGAVRAVSGELSEQIAALDRVGRAFWDFDEREIAEPPAQGDDAWPLWRAWEIVRGTPGAGMAVTHKVLHHKRPAVFPLLDNKTYEALGKPDRAWRSIHRDLVATVDAWGTLEGAFVREARARKGVPLTRLRLHDILLWTQAVGDWDECREAGRRLRRR